MKWVTYIWIHLTLDVLEEPLLFLPDHLILRMIRILIILNPLEMFRHNMFIAIFLLCDLVFVSLQGLFPSLALGWVVILNHSVILIRANIATVMQVFHLTSYKRRIPDKTITAQIDMTFHSRTDWTWDLRASAPTHCVAITSSIWAPMIRRGVARTYQALRLRNQVVLEVSSQMTCHTSAMLIEQLTGNEREKVKLVFLLHFLLLCFLKLVVELFLIVKEQEFVLQDLRTANFCLSLQWISVFHLVQEALVLFDLHAPLLLLLNDMLAHLFQVILEQLLVCHPVIECYLFPESH